MPIPSTNAVAMFPLQEVIFDKDDGELLSGGIVTFYRDVSRSVLKDVYQQSRLPDGTYQFTNIGSQLILSSIGSFIDDNGSNIIPFLFPYDAGTPDGGIVGNIDLYYITVDSSGLVRQFDIEAWPPNLVTNSNIPPEDLADTSDNQLANPQFVEILFAPPPGSSTYTFNVSGSNQYALIAPDWYIKTSGVGTVTVGRNSLTNQFVTDAPYSLSIASTGITDLNLVQRIVNSPRLFANGYVGGYLVAASTQAVAISMTYVPSDGISTPTPIFTDVTTTDNNYNAMSGVVAVDTAPFNADNASGYVDIVVNIAVNTATVNISSLQLVSASSLSNIPGFSQLSTPRQIDHLFHYYKPYLEAKPIQSYLVGWDFPLNPAQFAVAGGPGGAATNNMVGIGANKSAYMWDQTIAFQSVANAFQCGRESASGGFFFNALASSRFALVQYLPTAAAKELLTGEMSVKLKGVIDAGTLNGTVTLWWSTGAAPNINPGLNDSLVASIAANGVPTCGGGGVFGTWTQVPRGSLGNATFHLTTVRTAFDFSGFDSSATETPSHTAVTFAIVIAFDTLSSVGPPSVILEYCSLVKGHIPTHPGAQTYDEVLRECQYYYEKSYNLNIQPGVAGANYAGSVYQYQKTVAGGAAFYIFPSSFGITYNTKKRVAANVSFYDPGTGTANQATLVRIAAGANAATTGIVTTQWTLASSGEATVNYHPNTGTALIAIGSALPAAYVAGVYDVSGSIVLHYTADARLGIV